MRENTKGDLFALAFDLSRWAATWKPSIVGQPVRLGYKFFVCWLLGIDVPDTTHIGKNFRVYHGVGLVIHKDTVIGDCVTVRHNTTIGNARKGGGAPVIGDHVDIGANSVIIGEISIGDHSIIAAGSVVIRNVPANVIVAGNPAKVVKALV